MQVWAILGDFGLVNMIGRSLQIALRESPLCRGDVIIALRLNRPTEGEVRLAAPASRWLLIHGTTNRAGEGHKLSANHGCCECRPLLRPGGPAVNSQWRQPLGTMVMIWEARRGDSDSRPFGARVVYISLPGADAPGY